MKVTNRFNVPETLLALALRDDYNKGNADYSVTEIISPPRVQRLRKKHWDDMEQDVSDMLWQLMGSALHVVAEKGQAKNHITEERLITKIGNITLSGAMDIQQVIDGRILITDYKFTSAWALKADKFDWTAQQNIYAYLVREEKKMEVEGIRICALIRDWSRREAQYKADYPPPPFRLLTCPCGAMKRPGPTSKSGSMLTTMPRPRPTGTRNYRIVRTRNAGSAVTPTPSRRRAGRMPSEFWK
jgi:hypothetical protein